MQDLIKIDENTASYTVMVTETITMDQAEAELTYAQVDLDKANARITAAQAVIDKLITIGLQPTE
jgi:hypothetical protein